MKSQPNNKLVKMHTRDVCSKHTSPTRWMNCKPSICNLPPKTHPSNKTQVPKLTKSIITFEVFDGVVWVIVVGLPQRLVAQVTWARGLFQNQGETSSIVWFGILITIDVILLVNQSMFCECFLSLDSLLACCAPWPRKAQGDKKLPFHSTTLWWQYSWTMPDSRCL